MEPATIKRRKWLLFWCSLIGAAATCLLLAFQGTSIWIVSFSGIAAILIFNAIVWWSLRLKSASGLDAQSDSQRHAPSKRLLWAGVGLMCGGILLLAISENRLDRFYGIFFVALGGVFIVMFRLKRR